MAERGFELGSLLLIHGPSHFAVILLWPVFPNLVNGPWKVEAALFSLVPVVLAQCPPHPGWHMSPIGGRAARHSLCGGVPLVPFFSKSSNPPSRYSFHRSLCPFRRDSCWLFGPQVGKGALKRPSQTTSANLLGRGLKIDCPGSR